MLRFTVCRTWLFVLLLFAGGAIWSDLATAEDSQDRKPLDTPQFEATNDTAIEARLSAAVNYLASDELEGRGIGSAGLDKAAEFVANEFKKLGLQTDLYDGSPFQSFTMSTGAERGEQNSLAFVLPDGTKQELKLDSDFTPLALGGSATFDLPLVFVGYGITGKDEEYDDYAGVDVKDKAVIILRHEPQQDNPHSKFNGTKHSQHAPFVRKVSNAYEHGAAAVIFVTDEFDIKKSMAQFEASWQTALDSLAAAHTAFKQIEKPSDEQRQAYRDEVKQLVAQISQWEEKIVEAEDPLLPFQGAGQAESRRDLPVLYCRRSTIDALVKQALGKDLAQIEADVDKTLVPQSQELANFKLVGQTDVKVTEAPVKNVIAVLPGEGPLADETIVIGAHYDHVGRGGPGSAEPGSTEIHNGADDNASGTAALLEVARQSVALGPLPRRIVFVAFTAEERGLIGSARYVREPLFPLDQTVAMLNMDMVGRLADEKLIIYGTGTAEQFDDLTDTITKDAGFTVTKHPGGFGPSDHASFYAKKIPVLHFFTGTHSDYHRSTDDVAKINVSGMRRIANLVTQSAVALANQPDRPKYVEVKESQFAGGGGDRPYFGSIPDFAQDKPGYALMGVTKGSPAERAGLKSGDIIIRLGESKIGNLEDFDNALRKFKAGNKVPVVIQRGDAEKTFDVTLDPPKG
jgi:hypothetical protein